MPSRPSEVASYAIPVRRATALPTASFRFRLATDTLAVQLTVPTIKVRKGLSPPSHPARHHSELVRASHGATRHAWRTKKRAPKRPFSCQGTCLTSVKPKPLRRSEPIRLVKARQVLLVFQQLARRLGPWQPLPEKFHLDRIGIQVPRILADRRGRRNVNSSCEKRQALYGVRGASACRKPTSHT